MKKLKAMLEKKASLQNEMRAMSDKLVKETRAWTEEEEAKFNELKAEVENLTKTIDAIQEARELDDAEEQTEGGEKATDKPEAVEAKETRAFADYLRAVITNAETRTATPLAFSDNGAIVPKTIAQKIVTKIYDISPIVEKATHYTTKGVLAIPVYGANNSADINVAYADEFEELEDSIGKFTSVDLQNFLAGSLVKLSNSLINNTDIDLVDKAIELIAYAVARFLEGELLNGTASKIKGMQTLEAGQVIETAAAGTVSLDDLITLKNKVKQAFRKQSIWVMHTDTLTQVEKLKDADGRPLLNIDPTGEYTGKILGYPVYVSDNAKAVAGGNIVISFGDFSGLALKFSEELEIKVLREKYATQHATGIVAWIEADSKVENNQKLAQLKIKA